MHMIKYKYVPFSFGKQVSSTYVSKLSVYLISILLLFVKKKNKEDILVFNLNPVQRYDGKKAQMGNNTSAPRD